MEAIPDLFTAEAQFESVLNTTGIVHTTNKGDLRQLAQQSVEFFEQRRQTPVNRVVSENKVALKIEDWCRLARDMPNRRKSGEEMQLQGSSFFTIEDGFISRLADYM